MAQVLEKRSIVVRGKNAVILLFTKIPLSIYFILPVEGFLLFLLIVPAFISGWLSGVSWQPTYGIGIFEASWNGLRNYTEILTDLRFLNALWRTFFIAGVAVCSEFFIGLGLALLCKEDFFGKRVFVAIFIVPLMIMPVVVANNFFLLFQPKGPMNQIISWITRTNFALDWLANPRSALFVIILTEIWHWYPFMFLVMLGGLSGLPSNVDMAAQLLKASFWQRLWRIWLPQLKPIIFIAIIIRSMEALKIFDAVYILTRGGPGTSTDTLSTYMYEIGFKYYRTSFISAGAWIVLVISILIFTRAIKPFVE